MLKQSQMMSMHYIICDRRLRLLGNVHWICYDRTLRRTAVKSVIQLAEATLMTRSTKKRLELRATLISKTYEFDPKVK